MAGETTSTQVSTPWSSAQPYLLDIMEQARRNYYSGVGQNYFPGSTVVPFSPATEQAIQMREARGAAGSPVTRAAQGQINQTLGGQYLNPLQNPAWAVMADDISNRVNSTFGASGRTGSGAHAQALARGLSQGAAGLYDQERARQMQALGLAPQVGSLDLQDADLLAMAGGQREQLAGQELQDLINRFNFSQAAPNDAVARYIAAITGQGGQGGTSITTTNPPDPNRFLSVLGGGVAGSQIAGLPGAVVGGLLGLL